MSKTQFTVVAAFLTVILLVVSIFTFNNTGWSEKLDELNRRIDQLETSHIDKPSARPVPGDNCSICGRDRVSAHGSVLLKNTTPREVTIRVRHHPDQSESVIHLDPGAFQTVENILVGKMKLRAIGEGFDEESFCQIAPNTQHEMWWRTTGFEMHGTMAMHVGH